MFKDIFDNSKLFPPGSPFKDMPSLYDRLNNSYKEDKNKVANDIEKPKEPTIELSSNNTTNPLKPKLRG